MEEIMSNAAAMVRVTTVTAIAAIMIFTSRMCMATVTTRSMLFTATVTTVTIVASGAMMCGVRMMVHVIMSARRRAARLR